MSTKVSGLLPTAAPAPSLDKLEEKAREMGFLLTPVEVVAGQNQRLEP
jgi:hypothetical protein